MKRKRVGADFPLVNDTAILKEQVFNRVFNGDDMVVALVIYLVNQSGQSR